MADGILVPSFLPFFLLCLYSKTVALCSLLRTAALACPLLSCSLLSAWLSIGWRGSLLL
jgi:hypothetical protein